MPLHIQYVQYKNEIFNSTIEKSAYKFKILFPTYHRHIIIDRAFTGENLTMILKSSNK